MPVFLRESFPTAVIGPVGSTVTLPSLLSEAFGDNAQYITGVWLAYYGAPTLQEWNFKYWNMAAPALTNWQVNGATITAATSSSFNQTYVTSANFGSVAVQVGNNIMPNLYMTVRIDRGSGDPVYTQYAFPTVSSGTPYMAPDGHAPTPQQLVDTAISLASQFPSTPNNNDCHYIDEVVAAATGGTVPDASFSLTPSENKEGGFWRIAYRGVPDQNWEALTRPGDIVRFDWADPSRAQHTTMILGQLQPDGTIDVYDNIDYRSGTTYIGRHMANYDVQSVPASVTIYRLTTDDYYLIATTANGETVLGTTFNDNIQAGGGDDIVRSGVGNDLLDGGAGNDTLDGGAGSDTVDYSSATQAVVVDLPGRIALGGTQYGTDSITGVENVRTGSGNDAVAGDGATNSLDGGAGSDTVSYYAVASGVVLDLAGQVGVDGTSTDRLLNFENANGTAYNDAISGTAAANVLDGLGGVDTVSYYLASQGVVIDLAASIAVQGGITDTIRNFENVNGSGFNDSISGNAGANVLDGLGGIDTISYYTSSRGLVIDLASTVVVEGAVTDIVRNFENANATSYNDAVSGNAAANVLDGLGGIDTISYYASGQGVAINLSVGTGVSGGVTDTLRNFENANGSAFADAIIGDAGANVLNGLGGADSLTGGGDFDIFVFNAGQASGDVITDFTGNGTAAGDSIRLVGFGTTAQGATFTQLNATQWQIHSGLDGHNETLTLSNGAAVNGSDFFFV